MFRGEEMTKEFEELKQALKEAATPEARKAAAEAFRRYQAAEAARGKRRSRPNLVSLAYGKKYPTQIDVKDIGDELVRNPEFFDHLREIVEVEED